MDLTVSNLAAELRRQVVEPLPLDAPAFTAVTARVSITAQREIDLLPEALDVIKNIVKDEHPDWTVDVDHSQGDVTFRFYR